MTPEDQPCRRMQVKVLYSFDNSPTVFLSRSKNQYSVKVAQIPIPLATEEDNIVTLGAFDLKHCVQQILKSSPEHFKLQDQDYAVYYKDITEQPDEPFVANGVLSSLLSSSKQHLIPGRVCQNLSASFLFGDKANTSSLTLEIRLKLNVIDKTQDEQQQRNNTAEKMNSASHSAGSPQNQSSFSQPPQAARRNRPAKQGMSSYSSAIKATRTKSLPIFYHPPNRHISNIINADKSNVPSRYDSKSIQERFSLAPFMLAKIIDKPARKRRRSNVPLTPTVQTPVDNSLQPMRAMKTRSMVSHSIPSHSMISSPIQEELMSEGSDDTEYQENSRPIDEEDEEDEDEFDAQNDTSSSPYTPQQPPYKPHVDQKHHSNSILPNSDPCEFQSLPDLEDLDSKKTHTIPSTKLPHDHDLICINKNCAANDSITWRFFETKFHPSYLNIQRAEKFDKSLYDGMFGPLCNACYLFLRNKGFMRPEAVVKKYLQQQKYKKDLKVREDLANRGRPTSSPFTGSMVDVHKFPTPTHAPSAINEYIRNQHKALPSVNLSKQPTPQTNGRTPTDVSDYQDLNEFMNQLNSFGGPLTDIDLPQDFQSTKKDNTPPAMATKSNTRVINLYEDEEDKENQPPNVEDDINDFDQMIMKSFSLRSSPDQQDWSQFFGEPTPKDTNTPGAGQTPLGDASKGMNVIRKPQQKLDGQKAAVVNMPSSPLLSSYDDIANKNQDASNKNSSPGSSARRNDTTMSYVQAKSSPQSEIGITEEKQGIHGV